MPKKILQKGAPVLRKIAKEVPAAMIGTPRLRKILAEMSAALAGQDDGVAIAAPQIGYSLRIFAVSGKVFKKEGSEEAPPDLVFINPKISKLSREKEWLPEGCLSVRPVYGKTWRSKKASVSAMDEHGKKFTRGGSGLLAQIFQHETDHLDGILFVDHAKDLKHEKIK